jgi:formylglycine-generating enzyme required for sulfatase activity
MKHLLQAAALWLLLLTLVSQLATAHAQGTAFTYQGRLNDGASPATGIYDLRFTIYDALAGSGSQIGGTLTSAATAVSNGLFTVTLDFGAGVFNGADRWLEVGVRTNGGIAFTTLVPRQPITPTPYAIYSANAGSAATATTASSANSVSAANIVGTVPLAQLPGTVLTNNQNGVILNGTFTGNGTGLTNLNGQRIQANTINSNALDAATLALLIPTSTPVGMALIPARFFTMGNSIGDSDITDANPTNVTVSAFYMDMNLVSYSQWQSVYYWATNHGYGFVHAGSGKAANHPVQTVDWYDCVKWCNARSQQAGKTPVYYTDAGLTQVYTNGETTNLFANWAASGYRLPTEAEWEKAARGGLSGQRFPWGNVISESLANYNGDTASYSYDLGPNGYNATYATGAYPYTSPVGSFAANGYGLYDMAGNVFEWCWDWYGTPYAGGSDPRGPASGSNRVLRGGFWVGSASSSRCAYRIYSNPVNVVYNIGFRCVRGL